jgi:hypothetical protein
MFSARPKQFTQTPGNCEVRTDGGWEAFGAIIEPVGRPAYFFCYLPGKLANKLH